MQENARHDMPFKEELVINDCLLLLLLLLYVCICICIAHAQCQPMKQCFDWMALG